MITAKLRIFYFLLQLQVGFCLQLQWVSYRYGYVLSCTRTEVDPFGRLVPTSTCKTEREAITNLEPSADT